MSTHDGQLARALLAERRLHAARLGAVHEARGVQADRPGTDARTLAAREVAVAVVEDLVAVDVGVVVGRWHGQGVVVELAGTKLHTTKRGPAKVWCTGGGWWTRPVRGSKSWMESRWG